MGAVFHGHRHESRPRVVDRGPPVRALPALVPRQQFRRIVAAKYVVAQHRAAYLDLRGPTPVLHF